MRYLAILLLCASAVAQQLKISVQKFEVPVYPPIAKAAKISAVIQIEATVDADGNVTSVLTRSAQSPPDISDGHSAMIWKQLFSKAAEENLRQWKFHCDNCDYGEPYIALFRYEFFADKSPPEGVLCFTKHFEYNDEASCFNFPRQVTMYTEYWYRISDPVIHPRWWWRFSPSKRKLMRSFR